MLYENITFLEAVYLLAQIYLIPFPNNPFEKNHPLVTKYRNTFLQEEFLNLLDKGLTRLNENYSQNGNYFFILKQYQKLESQIIRIYDDKVDSNFQFKPKSKTKVLKLDIPDFHETL